MPTFYALDIETETDTAVPDGIRAGLDPRWSPITSVAVYSPAGTLVLDDPNEGRMLRALHQWLGSPHTAPGVIVTWNGSCFDLPYLADRARRHRIDLGITLEPADVRAPKYEPLPGHDGGYRARVGRHDHLDVAYAWRDHAAAAGVRWGLKPVAASLAIPAIEVDRTDMATLTVAERMAYNLSDAVVTHELALRLGDAADRLRDRL